MQGLDGKTIRKLVPAAGQLAREPLAHRLTRASKGRYTQVQSPAVVMAWFLLPALISIAGIVMYAIGISGSALVFTGAWIVGILVWIVDMAVIDLKIKAAAQRIRRGRCSMCMYQLAVPTAGDEAAALSLVVCPECGASVFGATGAASPAAEPEAPESPSAPEAPPCGRHSTRWLGLVFVLIFWAFAGHWLIKALNHVPPPLWIPFIVANALAIVVSVALAVRSALARKPCGRDLREMGSCPECGAECGPGAA